MGRVGLGAISGVSVQAVYLRSCRDSQQGALWLFGSPAHRWRRQMMEFTDKSPLRCETIVFASETLDYATAALSARPLLLH